MNDKKLGSLNLKVSYDPSVDGSDVIKEFYIPCISNSIKYDRCSAYFTSEVLKQFATGLLAFAQNGGHGRFIFSSHISSEEMDLIVNAYKEKMDSLTERLDSSLENDYEIANLAYLIKHNIIEVKIAFMLNTKSALMHIKCGEFEDEYGNKVYFSGSGNETEAGIRYNAEVFDIFTNANDTENKHLIEGEERFERLWNNEYSPIVRTEFPQGALFEKLVSYSKDKLFTSKEDFFSHENVIFVDINKENKQIIIEDFTKNPIIANPSIYKTIYKDKFESINERKCIINELSLHNIRDVVPSRVTRYGKKLVYSDDALKFINEYDLLLNKRIKLAESIKTNQNLELWEEEYLKFKMAINKEMSARLKEEQYRNAFHHYSMKSSMDFSVPGTGKTYISYGLFAYLYSIKEVDHFVVFGPLNCFKAWKEEAACIFKGKHDFTIFDITMHRDNYEYELSQNKYNIYLFNYEFINEKKIEFLNREVIDKSTLIVFDEIHKLKAIGGTRSGAMISLIKKASSKPIYKLALTGTPLPNSFKDLYNYIDILYYDDLDGFLNSLSLNQLKEADNNNFIAKKVSNSLHPLFTRTTKKDLNIPPANEDDLTTLSVNASGDERQLFALINRSCRNPLLRFTRLIQAASNPKLTLKTIDINEMKDIYGDYGDNCGDYFEDDELIYAEEKEEIINRIGIATKTKRTIDFVVEKVNEKKKVLVWCLFIDTIDLVKNELRKRGVNCISITGRDEASKRSMLIDEFKYSDVDVLITNPNTLAESISLHLWCHDAVYLEYGFNLTYLLQSKDRIHRVGLLEGSQTNYYFAMCHTPFSGGIMAIDERIYKRLETKAERMYKTIESNELIRFADSSDIDDIKEILGIK